jgi:hypothetical protein
MAECSEHDVNCILVTNLGKLEVSAAVANVIVTFFWRKWCYALSNLILSLNRVSDMT